MGSGLWNRSNVTITQCNSNDNRSIYHIAINQSISYIKLTGLTSQKLREEGTVVQVFLVMLTHANISADFKPAGNS